MSGLFTRGVTVRVLPRFPARVSATDGVQVAVTGGGYAFSLDYANVLAVGATMALPTTYVLLWDSVALVYRRVTLTDLKTLLA